MAGVKGKSGGPRANSGGSRPGAGRPRKEKPPLVEIEGRDMLTLLQDIALGRVEASTGQIRAAIAAVQYTHTKKGDGGKKEEAADRAKKVAVGRFSASPPPLRAVR